MTNRPRAIASASGWLVILVLWTTSLRGQLLGEIMPELQVVSARVANQVPAGTFSMPVSGLRYEPRVDLFNPHPEDWPTAILWVFFLTTPNNFLLLLYHFDLV